MASTYEYPQEDFFGFGADSSEDARTNYLIDAVDTGTSLHWTLRKFDFGTSVSYFNPRNTSGTDDLYPSIEQGFDPSQLPGFGTETDFLRVDQSIAFDWRDNPSLPRAGGRYAVTLTQYQDRDLRQFDFKRVDIALQQYVPLPNRYRRLALRAEGSFTDADTGQTVPFYLQPTLGGARNLRGFREFRFRDTQQRARQRRVSVGSVVGARCRAVCRCRHGGADPSTAVDAGRRGRLRRRVPFP